MATLCRRESRLPLLCPVQVNLLIIQKHLLKECEGQSEYYKAEKGATTELGDIPIFLQIAWSAS